MKKIIFPVIAIFLFTKASGTYYSFDHGDEARGLIMMPGPGPEIFAANIISKKNYMLRETAWAIFMKYRQVLLLEILNNLPVK